jgi:hypothetical protein
MGETQRRLDTDPMESIDRDGITTADQNRRIEELAIETNAATMKVTPIGPASLEAVLIEAFDENDHRIAVERLRANGIPADPGPWLQPPVALPQTPERPVPTTASGSGAA